MEITKKVDVTIKVCNSKDHFSRCHLDCKFRVDCDDPYCTLFNNKDISQNRLNKCIEEFGNGDN